jgi:Druantia protein DruA/Transposase DDE domain
MDHKIENLKSTTFGGRIFKRHQISMIQTLIKTCSGLSRSELARTVCEHLKWTTPRGTYRIAACLNALEQMEFLEIITLPKKMEQKKKTVQKIICSNRTNEATVITTPLDDLMPISLQIVTEKEDIAQWNEFVDRYHYLGYKRPIGSHLRYYLLDRHGRKLGCLLFSFATTTLPCRDQWIGWDKRHREKHLNLVINNNRFLIFPWVKVNNMASKAQSCVIQQIGDDWEAYHGYRPVLLETFVDPSKYKGTCYKAANWQCIGKTSSLKSRNKSDDSGQKDVYIYPLCSDEDTRAALMDRKKSPSQKAHPFKTANIAKDSQVYLWQKIITVVATIAENFDNEWQKRRRVLSTLLIILFIFRLVFSKNKQGYGSTIAELWEYCHKLNIKLPQGKPVVPAAFCNARMKMDEVVFKQLNTEIIRTYESKREDHRWLGHRLFAIDGTKINLPKELQNHAYKKPSDNAHYPQGLVSCLYQLKSEIPYDFELSSLIDERALALHHLHILNKEDIVVYDRGYFSYAMLYAHHQKEIYAVFRLQSNSFKVIDEFIDSADPERMVIIEPDRNRKKEILTKHPDIEFIPLQLRLIKYVVVDTTFIIGTTLTDVQRYPAGEFQDVYHSRWGIEELYKISKLLIDVEDFHAKTERGVKQELFAHFVIITLGKIFLNQTNDALLLGMTSDKSEKIKANQKNCFITIAKNLEALFLDQANRVKEVIGSIVSTITTCYQYVRSGRSYLRVSHKIPKKWRPASRRKKSGVAPTGVVA